MKELKNPKRAISLRLTEVELAALDELQKTGGVINLFAEKGKGVKKSVWLRFTFHLFLHRVLTKEISELQVNSYSDDAGLFVLWARAKRGIKGYGFTTRDKKTRFVYGPSLTDNPLKNISWHAHIPRTKKKRKKNTSK